MEQPSEFEVYLAYHQADGVHDSSGEFTLSREKAALRLRAFQLPYEGAWAVKLIQAAVAAESKGITIRAGRREIRIDFNHRSWDLHSVESSFYSPSLVEETNRSLSHLVVGLRGVSEVPFELRLEGSGTSLVCNGTQMYRRALKQASGKTALSILNCQPNADVRRELSSAKSRLAELQTALARHCFVCPVPLNLDGLRLDSLLRTPIHGWTTSDFPVAIGFPSEEELPELGIPPATLEPRHDGRARGIGESAGFTRAVSEKMMTTLEEAGKPPDCTGFGLITAHTICEPHSGHRVPMVRPSTLFWVEDGALLEKEKIHFEARFVSLAVFVSAVGLEKDLTSLALRRTESRFERRVLAIKMGKAFLAKAEPPFDSALEAAASQGKRYGKAIGTAGLGFLAFPPTKPVGAVAVGIGALMVKLAGGESYIQTVRTFQGAFEQLRREAF